MAGYDRRSFLAAVAAGVTALAGCSGDATRRDPFDAPTRSPRPAERETPTPSFTADEGRPGDPVPPRLRAGPATTCPAGVTAFDPPWVVAAREPLDGFLLSIRDGFLSLGQTVRCELRNFSDGTRTTGPRDRVDVQYRGADGWRTVFGGPPGGVVGNVTPVTHSVGGGFTWEFPFTREGLAGLVADESDLRVCGPVGPGIYRFVYSGVRPQAEAKTGLDLALAKPFRVRAR